MKSASNIVENAKKNARIIHPDWSEKCIIIYTMGYVDGLLSDGKYVLPEKVKEEEFNKINKRSQND